MSSNLPSPEQVFRQVPCFCGALLVAARSVTRLYNEELRSEGIEVTQFSILMLLKALGPVPLGALGERLAVDKTTISRNIRVLSGTRGTLTAARTHESEWLSLTGAGGPLLDRVRPRWDRAQKRMRASPLRVSSITSESAFLTWRWRR
ncbi:MAG: winged helix-turn-helix transcriptional regulator [Planctomycetes bacterium]|nr:winged helix-turn-helix transcriptional regulator [Planctomycetota bacterium]